MIAIAFKRCSTCRQVRVRGDFFKDTRRWSGLSPCCRDCRREYCKHYSRGWKPKKAAENRRKNRIVSVAMKTCRLCLNSLPASSFSRVSTLRDGLDPMCKSCKREVNARNYRAYLSYHRHYRREHYDRYLAHARRWSKANPSSRRSRDARRAYGFLGAGSFTRTEWARVLAENPLCPGCGTAWSDSVKPTVDHVTPISKGGPNTIDNIQPLCKPCNCAKNDKMDWKGAFSIKPLVRALP